MNPVPVSRMLTILGWIGVVSGVGFMLIGLSEKAGPFAGYAGIGFGAIASGAAMLGLAVVIDLLSDLLTVAGRSAVSAAKSEAIVTGNCPDCGSKRLNNEPACRNCGYSFSR